MTADSGVAIGDPPPAKKKKRKKPFSATKKTLDELRKRGALAQVVERWNPHANVRQDLFGVIDIVVIDGTSILGVQATANGNHIAHRKKMLAEPRAKAWVEAGGRLELWSWEMRGAAGKRKRWTLRVETYAEMVSGAAL